MNELAINKFLKGIVSDLDPSIVQNNQWCFPTSGIRIINVPGKGFSATLANGTELFFQINTKYAGTAVLQPYIVGSVEYKGILYLVVVYSDGNTSITEIGSYHSPKQFQRSGQDYVVNTNYTGFEDKYLPLLIIERKGSGSPTTRRPLYSDNFGYTSDSIVWMLVKESYDGSSDLYFGDGENPNYCVNTGFNQLGIVTSRVIDFPQFANGSVFKNEFLQVRGISNYPSPNSIDQSNDGYLKFGNYFFFIRYMTDSLDRTGFITEVGPIQVGQGYALHDLQGGAAASHGSKSVKIKITNHDPSYKYIEVCFVRYYGELGFSSFESFLISKKYDNANKDIIITGYEALEPISIGEILRHSIYEKKCSHAIQLNNRFMGTDWKGEIYNRNDMADLFLSVKPLTTRMCEKNLMDPGYYAYVHSAEGKPTGYENPEGYKDFKNTLEYVGFFRGETYPFAGIALLDDGTVTEAFPIKGGKIVENVFSYDNNVGLIKFPFYDQAGAVQGIDNQERVLGLTLDLSVLKALLLTEKYNNVKGIYIVRGERKSNLLFQGIMYPAMTGPREIGEKVLAPSFGDVPFIQKTGGTSHEHPGTNYIYTSGTNDIHPQAPEDVNALWTIFAPDWILDTYKASQLITRNHIKVIATLDFEVKTYDGFPHTVLPIKYFEDIRKFNSLRLRSTSCSIHHISDNQTPNNIGGRKWGSYFERGVYSDFVTVSQYYPYLVKRCWNRKMSFVRYLGVTLDTVMNQVTWKNAHNKPLRYLVNVYQSESDPELLYETLRTSFDPAFENYYKISDLITKDTQDIIVLYKGDSFLQRSTFRALHWHDLKDGDGWDDWEDEKIGIDPDTKIKYGHGVAISMLTENVSNVAMRDNDQNNETYFPLIAADTFGWIFNTVSQYINEALYYNPGYHRTLSIASFRGWDKILPLYTNNRPTRIRNSGKYSPGQFYDAWRVFDILGYKDYSIAYGKMIGLFEHMGVLGSIQEKAINRHYTEEKELRIPTSESEILLGTGEFLSESIVRIAEYGSQHVLGFINGEFGVYGIDYQRKIFWIVKTEMSAYGRLHLNAFDLSKEKMINTELKRLLQNLTTSDELPYQNRGVLLGWDTENKEIHLSILPNTETLVYSETLSEFIGMMPYVTPRYIQHMKGLISLKRSGNNLRLYLHLPEPVDQNIKMPFQDKQNVEFTLSWIVNGLGEEGKEMLLKMFESMEIEALPIPFSNIELKTSFQSYSDIFIKGHALEPEPEYEEGVWVVPMPVANNSGNIFQQDSTLSGSYILISLRYIDSEMRNQFIRHVKTFYNRSII